MRDLARAFAGAAIFGLPLLMTMEMWSLGFSLDPLKLALFAAYPVALFVFGFVLPAERAQLQRLVRGVLKGRRVVTSVS